MTWHGARGRKIVSQVETVIVFYFVLQVCAHPLSHPTLIMHSDETHCVKRGKTLLVQKMCVTKTSCVMRLPTTTHININRVP